MRFLMKKVFSTFQQIYLLFSHPVHRRPLVRQPQHRGAWPPGLCYSTGAPGPAACAARCPVQSARHGNGQPGHLSVCAPSPPPLPFSSLFPLSLSPRLPIGDCLLASGFSQLLLYLHVQVCYSKLELLDALALSDNSAFTIEILQRIYAFRRVELDCLAMCVTYILI